METTVTVDPARADERPLIEGLFQFYVYDFAEMYGPGSGFDIGDDGRFSAYPHMAGYWSEQDRRPFVIRFEGRPAGFVLLNAVSHRGAAIDHAVAEFFVMRQYRRSGVGQDAARWIFGRYPGRWELAIAAPNAGARAFWLRAVLGAPGVRDLTAVKIGDGDRTILSFVSGPA